MSHQVSLQAQRSVSTKSSDYTRPGGHGRAFLKDGILYDHWNKRSVRLVLPLGTMPKVHRRPDDHLIVVCCTIYVVESAGPQEQVLDIQHPARGEQNQGIRLGKSSCICKVSLLMKAPLQMPPPFEVHKEYISRELMLSALTIPVQHIVEFAFHEVCLVRFRPIRGDQQQGMHIAV
nr:hypothetical protein CFP56_09986 [Quercus suber]